MYMLAVPVWIYTLLGPEHLWVVQGVMADVPASKGHKAGFALQHMLKDLHLAREAAGTAGSPAPMTEQALEIYEKVGIYAVSRTASAALRTLVHVDAYGAEVPQALRCCAGSGG